MVEPYIAGLELAVAVMDGRALAVTEIEAATGFYDYEAKYGEGGSVHHLPARLPEAVTERALEQAVRAHVALGCSGVSRSDFRYDDAKGDLVLLEVNTQPGMTPDLPGSRTGGARGDGFRSTRAVDNSGRSALGDRVTASSCGATRIGLPRMWEILRFVMTPLTTIGAF